MSSIEERKKLLQEEVQGLETDINERINSVKVKVQETLSVQKWVQDYPLPAVGLAALAGFLLAYRSGKPKSTTSQSSSLSAGVRDMLVAELKKQALKKVMEKLSEKFS
jgi:hypothetical protein